jgi:hypothetical protein
MHNEKTESPLSNSISIDILQRLFFSEAKPSQITTVDIAVAAYLVLRRCVDHEVYDSHATIATRIGASVDTVKRSLPRLERCGWIVVSGRGTGLTKGYSINIETFPAAQPVRDQITPEAKKLAASYMQAIQRLPKHPKTMRKNWLPRQWHSAQRILTHCGGNYEVAWEIIRFALTREAFKKRAATSLYKLLGAWGSLYKDYCECKQKYEAQSQSTKGEAA